MGSGRRETRVATGERSFDLRLPSSLILLQAPVPIPGGVVAAFVTSGFLRAVYP